MKILTSVQQGHLGGIVHSLSSLAAALRRPGGSSAKVVCIDLKRAGNGPSEPVIVPNEHFSVVPLELSLRPISEVLDASETLEEVRKAYQPLIEAYEGFIRKERPDVILINGTYYVPWCLLLASKRFAIPTVLRYHGSLSKETENWTGTPRRLCQEMEKQFDQKNLSYIFPSQLIHTTVEKEVFGHRINKHFILPNAIPLHFFDVKPTKGKARVGVVSRWTKVKNPEFVGKLAKYNARQKDPLPIHVVTDLRRTSAKYQELQSSMTFKRPMNREKLAEFYGKMSIVVSPSHFETYGNAPQEALASGTPALVSQNMGVAETFQALGLERWITEFNSPSKVHQKIREVSTEHVSDTVRSQMRELYAPHVINSRMLGILQST